MNLVDSFLVAITVFRHN